MADYFNVNSQINRSGFDRSTFDIMDVDKFHNTKGSTVFSYILTWLLMFLSWVLLGIDMYTCITILAFHRWLSDSYQPYAYLVAKWIFTGCIIFQFCLLLYKWIWAIHTYKTRNIALVYVNPLARLLYVVRSYNYHCLFHKIEKNNSFDWACFLTYGEIDSALQILIADTPRQVINILTLRYYATDGESSNDIISNIKDIADTNILLSVVLSFMVLSVGIWSIFFFRFLLGMLMYIPVKVKLSKRGYKSLKKYCCYVVNENVRRLVFSYHKPKDELLEKGILDLDDIKANPLLNSSTTDFDGYSHRVVSTNTSTSLANEARDKRFASTSTSLAYDKPHVGTSRRPSNPSLDKRFPSNSTFSYDRYNDDDKLINQPYRPMERRNPFADQSTASLRTSDSTTSLVEPVHPLVGTRNNSTSSLTPIDPFHGDDAPHPAFTGHRKAPPLRTQSFGSDEVPLIGSVTDLAGDPDAIIALPTEARIAPPRTTPQKASHLPDNAPYPVDEPAASVPYPIRGVSMYGESKYE